MDAPSPALEAARRLARRAGCLILPVDDAAALTAARGKVLLVDRAPDDTLLAALAAVLPEVEALVLWAAGVDPDVTLAALGAHGFEHGSVNVLDAPEPAVLAILTASEDHADAQAAALARPERPFRALAVMPAFNEADVIGPAIGALVSEGVDVYLLDHRSTDATVEAVRPWLGRGLVRVERFPDESGPGFDERNGTEMVWTDILRRVEQVTGEVQADWYLFVNADEFREAPWPQTTLAEGLREVDELGFSAVNFELVNFRPTPQDAFVDGDDVREHLRFYEPPGQFDLSQIKAWKGQAQPVNLHERGGHDVLFEGKRVFPVPFVLRHYPIRSAAHGRRKVHAERLARFAAEERERGWHVQYDHYDDDADYLHDRAELTEWDGDRFRADLLARATRQLLLLDAVSGAEPALPTDVPALTGWMTRRGHAPLAALDLEPLRHRLLHDDPAGVPLHGHLSDLATVIEAQGRARGEVQTVVRVGVARQAA